MFGFLNVHKPAGPTSHDVVAAIRRRIGRKLKVGHAGTLDPFADGVLVVCLGQAARLADYVRETPKRYAAEVTLGATSTTDDPEGRITPTSAAPAPSAERVGEVLAGFVGRTRQVPPAYSAIHVGGRRAYQLARAGEPPDLPARTVTVTAIDLVDYEYPRLAIDVTCGSGTYIRALARDVGEALGVGGYCSRLTRTAVGSFRLADAIAPDRIDPVADLLDPLAALDALPRVTLSPDPARRLTTGQTVGVDAPPAPTTGEIAALDERGHLIAIAIPAGAAGEIRPVKVFPTGS